MPHDPILHLLGLAKKAGRLEIGEEPVGAAGPAHQARVLLLAADARPQYGAAGPPTSERPGAPCGSKCPSPRRSWGSSWDAAPAPCWR